MDKYPDMGEITGLRLELGRERDRANAFEAALRKEVAVVIADAIKDAAKSVAENDQLKQDIVRLSSQVVGLQVNALKDPSMCSAFVKAAHKDYDDLKAEVERLTKQVAYYEMRHKELVADKRRMADQLEDESEDRT